MKIIMILDKPYPSDARVYPEAKSLIKAGHEITLLSWDKNAKNPKYEKLDEINVVRSYNSKFMEILPYDIFRLHWWWRKGFNDALKLFEKNSYDVVHCHDLSSLPIGIKLKKKFDCKLVYDAHEIWGYMVEKDLHNVWSRYYLKKEKKLLEYVDQIITVNEPLKKYFKKITRTPITIIMNCKPLINKSYEPSHNKKMKLIYLGGLRKPRFLLEAIEVINEIPDVEFIIGGHSGKKKYIEELKKKCKLASNVNFIGKVPMEEVLTMTKNADVVFCMFDPNDKNNKVGLPNKVFESMVVGRPIIVTKNVYSGIFVEKKNIGLAIPCNKKSLKEAILILRDNPDLRRKLGQNALNAAIRKYNWKEQEKKLLTIYGG